MLHLYHGASPSGFICIQPAHTVGLLCSLPLVIIFCEAQWDWLLGGVMERVSCCHQCYSSTLHQLLKFDMLSKKMSAKN